MVPRSRKGWWAPGSGKAGGPPVQEGLVGPWFKKGWRLQIQEIQEGLVGPWFRKGWRLQIQEGLVGPWFRKSWRLQIQEGLVAPIVQEGVALSTVSRRDRVTICPLCPGGIGWPPAHRVQEGLGGLLSTVSRRD